MVGVYEELIRRAQACDTCGKQHQAREIGVELSEVTWADPKDGHPYARYSSHFGFVEVWLRRQSDLDQRVTPGLYEEEEVP